MKREVADKWVAALRSGSYKRTDGRLQRGDSYCCLGVLCRVAKRNGLAVDVARDENDEDVRTFDGEDLFLPMSVQKWAGMATRDGKFDPNEKSLDELNDQGMGFTRLANLIEKNWEKL